MADPDEDLFFDAVSEHPSEQLASEPPISTVGDLSVVTGTAGAALVEKSSGYQPAKEIVDVVVASPAAVPASAASKPDSSPSSTNHNPLPPERQPLKDVVPTIVLQSPTQSEISSVAPATSTAAQNLVPTTSAAVAIATPTIGPTPTLTLTQSASMDTAAAAAATADGAQPDPSQPQAPPRRRRIPKEGSAMSLTVTSQQSSSNSLDTLPPSTSTSTTLASSRLSVSSLNATQIPISPSRLSTSSGPPALATTSAPVPAPPAASTMQLPDGLSEEAFLSSVPLVDIATGKVMSLLQVDEIIKPIRPMHPLASLHKPADTKPAPAPSPDRSRKGPLGLIRNVLDSRSSKDVAPVLGQPVQFPKGRPACLRELVYAQDLFVTSKQENVWVARFSANNQLLATASDRIVRVWLATADPAFIESLPAKLKRDLKDPGGQPFYSEPLCVFSGHEGTIVDIAWSATGMFLLTASIDNHVGLWHVHESMFLFMFRHDAHVTSVAFHPKLPLFVSSTYSGQLSLWSYQDRVLLSTNRVPPDEPAILSVCFAPDGSLVFVGTLNGICSTFKIENKTLVYWTQAPLKKETVWRTESAFINGRLYVLATTEDRRVRLLHPDSLEVLIKYRGCRDSDSQPRASFTPDARAIVLCVQDSYVYFWDTFAEGLPRRDRNENALSFYASSAPVTAVAISGGTQPYLAVATNDGHLHFFAISWHK
eukprot:m.47129 g.47129  ORF g.47129 m.47129 type:complete len:708 (+) comp11231_c0_seq1:54-2177(+)